MLEKEESRLKKLLGANEATRLKLEVHVRSLKEEIAQASTPGKSELEAQLQSLQETILLVTAEKEKSFQTL